MKVATLKRKHILFGKYSSDKIERARAFTWKNVAHMNSRAHSYIPIFTYEELFYAVREDVSRCGIRKVLKYIRLPNLTLIKIKQHWSKKVLGF